MNREDELQGIIDFLTKEIKELKKVLRGLHFCRCGCSDDNIKAVKQVLGQYEAGG